MEEQKTKKPDRYISIEGIDCFGNSLVVIQEALRILEQPEYKNAFWDLFLKKLPEDYTSREQRHNLLYLVCSQVYYLEELFEQADSKEGIEYLGKCEYECC